MAVTTGWHTPVCVDSVRLGVRLDYHQAGLELVKHAVSVADTARGESPTAEQVAMLPAGGAPGQLVAAGVVCVVRRAANWYQVRLETGDWTAEVTARKQAAAEQEAPGVLVMFRSSALAERGLTVVDEFLSWCFRALGVPAVVQISRLDLYMDLASSEPSLEWLVADQLVTRAATNGVRLEPSSWGEPEGSPLLDVLLQGSGGVLVDAPERPTTEAGEVEAMRERRRLTSINIGARGRDGCYLRLYDKALQARKLQLAHVEPMWRRMGWDGVPGLAVPGQKKPDGTIWRVEFELGRGWLLNFGVSSWADLQRVGVLHLWSYLTRKWCRVVVAEGGAGRGSAGRGRASEAGGAAESHRTERGVVSFWEAVQAGGVFTRFDPAEGIVMRPHHAAPAHRVVRPLRVDEDQLKASASGTLATLFAGRDMDSLEVARAVLDVAMVALSKVPEKVLNMSVPGQAKLTGDPVTGEVPSLRGAPTKRELVDLMRQVISAAGKRAPASS